VLFGIADERGHTAEDQQRDGSEQSDHCQQETHALSAFGRLQIAHIVPDLGTALLH
jgi:hypothetical protein